MPKIRKRTSAVDPKWKIYALLREANLKLARYHVRIEEAILASETPRRTFKKMDNPPPIWASAYTSGGGGGRRRSSCMFVTYGSKMLSYCRYWHADGSYSHSEVTQQPDLTPIR